MNDTDPDATKPLGLLNYGHSYWVAARSLQGMDRRCTHPEAPVEFLFYHACELLLKAYLLHKGVTLDVLKGKGHRLERLAAMGEAQDLHLDQASREMITNISKIYMESRYIEVGRTFRFQHDDLHALCGDIFHKIAQPISKARGLKRLPNPPA